MMFHRLITCFLLLLSPLPLLAASLQVQPWPAGAKAAHTIAHDDVCGGNTGGIFQHALPVLQARGLHASLGLIAGLCNEPQWQQLKQALQAGHELFNHTTSHVGMLEPGSLAPIAGWDNLKEIAQAQRLVQAKLDYSMQFVAFPSDLATPEAKAFAAAQPEILGLRAAKHLYDGSNAGLNAVDEIDPLFVKWDMYWRDGKWSRYKPANGNMLIQHAQAALESGSWSYRTMHGVADGSFESVPLTQYTEYADFLAAKVKAGELWVAPPTAVLRYAISRQQCALQLQGKQIKVDASGPDCQRYHTALTVDLTPDADWQGQFSQQGQALASQKLTNGQYRILLDPTKGDVRIQ
ncbi:polysaccharide deacetylase family protein [Chitinibacter tainanensis]|uniref:polysaccharide deacetylase family protein n=1 Tax=Chitinibacter tainanensis TaxID=230667 RepID=UPI000410CF4F|nr:polysaccharide deacetylase family protein [Chitinibacter tainanensis]